MQRRSFLRLSALTFTSLLGHAGCKGSSSSEGTGDTGSSSGGSSRQVVDAPERFPQSVASGDPRPDGVIVWARVEDPDLPDADYEVELEIWPTGDEAGGGGGGGGDGADEGTAGGGSDTETTGGDSGAPVVVMVTAEARFDHCVKVRVEGLQPGTAYSYRFLYIKEEIGYASRTAQTKTAPAPDADVPVRFAFASCQDFGGRWYNAYVALLEQPDLDFFVHLGDYVYETAGDSSFQGGTEERGVTFDDQAGAIELTSSGGETYYAARSLDNYRQLYRTFRSDSALQAVHEQLAMIAIWDDHEFSDDCHGQTATYTDGRQDETDAARRAAANQAWFEYMPVDYADPAFTYDTAVAPPDDIRIHRDIEYGQHVHLVMTDLRSYRPDHLVPEDAYPGAIALDETQLATVTDVANGVPYVDIDAYADGTYAELLRQVAMDAGYDPARITGNVSAVWINDTIADAESDLPPIEEMELETLPRGLAFHQIFKTGLFGQIGARYLLARDPFLWYATFMQGETDGAAQRIMGQDQQDWFLDTMRGSTHTWKIWGNEFCLTSLNVDLSGAPLAPPFNQAFTMSSDDWNGAPHNRAELIDALAEVENVVAITGDIHAFFAGTPFNWAGAAEGNRVVELVTGAISSSTYRSLLVGQVQADPGLSSVPGIEAFAQGIRDLLQGGPNPCMGYCEPGMHGFAVVTASAGELLVDFHMIAEDQVASSRYDDAGLAGDFAVESFMVSAGSRDLYRLIEAEWRRWDPTMQQWV